MDALLQTVKNGPTLSKAFFLLVSGVLFVFAVQVVFYLIIKLWPKNKQAKGEN
ncbi:MAG: hypothetical protein LBT93_07665 [Treponema sp.]|jgi:hypothetical protein|nr:hypothetical protein [Treponema sp.]